MITLQDFFEAVGYRITEGSDYGWQCYGDRVHQLSAWNGIHGAGGWSANVIFSTMTQEVFEAEVCDYTNDRAYRLINPAYKKAFDDEASSRGEHGNQAWDDVDYIDLEVKEDFMEKLKAIVAGEEYDTRVQIQVDLSEEELLKYMMFAHERDMTFNQLVEEAIRNAIETHAKS